MIRHGLHTEVAASATGTGLLAVPASEDQPDPHLSSRARWHHALHRFCNVLFFDRLSLLNSERIPAEGPVLFIGLHRNGAVDGFAYHQVFPHVSFLISTQLLRNAFTRAFFDGIPVARPQDANRPGCSKNAISACVDVLHSGGRVFIFPEGTSSLGPHHLPFKSGAARVAAEALRQGRPVRIVPVGIHYEKAWAFRGRVEVVIGKPLDVSPRDSVGELRSAMTEVL